MAIYDAQYKFEELGIPTEDGFTAGSFAGVAYINCHEQGDEYIHDIEVKQKKWDSVARGWATRHSLLDKASPLYVLLIDILERHHHWAIADVCAEFWEQEAA